MKILFTYGNETKEGYESRLPQVNPLNMIRNESVDEIIGEGILEKVPGLVSFIEECYRILKFDGKCIFNSPYYASRKAWISPLAVRGISEYSLSFASKQWRDLNKFTECIVKADFEVIGQFALEESVSIRPEPVRNEWINKYSNVIQAMMFTLTKKRLDDKKE